jgi:hypothetical protein
MHPAAILGIVILALVVVAIPLAGWRRHPEGERIVRCRSGHLFTSIVIPGASIKAVRLGNRRLQWCPVGRHWTVVRPVDEATLTEAERDAAASSRDAPVP